MHCPPYVAMPTVPTLSPVLLPYSSKITCPIRTVSGPGSTDCLSTTMPIALARNSCSSQHLLTPCPV